MQLILRFLLLVSNYHNELEYSLESLDILYCCYYNEPRKKKLGCQTRKTIRITRPALKRWTSAKDFVVIKKKNSLQVKECLCVFSIILLDVN